MERTKKGRRTEGKKRIFGRRKPKETPKKIKEGDGVSEEEKMKGNKERRKGKGECVIGKKKLEKAKEEGREKWNK